MSLPSQTARPASIGRATTFRRRKANYKPLVGAGAVVLVLGLGAWGATKYFLGGEGQVLSPQAAGAGTVSQPPAQDSGKLLATDGGLKPTEQAATPPSPPVERPLVELRQGRASAPANVPPPEQPAATPQPAQPKPQPPIQAPPMEQPKANPVPPAAPGAGGFAVPADLQPTAAAAQQKQGAGDLVTARVLYSRVLADHRVAAGEKAKIRAELTKINEELVFSPKVAKDDPFTDIYVVQSGDSLVKIGQKLALGPDHRFMKRANRLVNEHRLNVGQKLKVVKGPFHAVVSKSAYRMDVYMGPPDKQDQWVYVRSYNVGLGADDGTPVGSFFVKKGAKLVDPPWVNPKTGESFAGGDPKNPIGKFWVAIEGVGESAQYVGFGIHGTIEPESIGKAMSMGCVRLLPEDIAVVYELLGEVQSQVKIVP